MRSTDFYHIRIAGQSHPFISPNGAWGRIFISSFITILIGLSGTPIVSQDLNSILNSDFTRQESLLIQSEVRKKIGSRANRPEVRELVKNLIPWSKMEGFTHQEFAESVSVILMVQDSGASFQEIEEIIPLIPKYRTQPELLVMIGKSFQEADKAKVPVAVRDSWIYYSLKDRFSGEGILLGMRLLILSRKEGIESGKFIKELRQKLPKNPRLASDLILKRALSQLTQDFQEKETKEIVSRTERSMVKLRRVSSAKLSSELAADSELYKTDWELFGDLEIRRRPKVEFTAEDFGIGTDGSSVGKIPQPMPGGQEDPSLGTPGGGLELDWKILNRNFLSSVVKDWLGVRYVYGGNTKSGVDCSGFTIGVLTHPNIGVPRSLLPRSARDQARIGTLVSRNDVRAGDLVFFSASPNQEKITHVGLAMGGNKFSHASSSRGVVIQWLEEKWWRDRFVTSRRIFQEIR
jgi:hypothetical protein